MFCNQCGQPVPQGSRFCNHCGAAIAVAAAAPPGVAAPQNPAAGAPAPYPAAPAQMAEAERVIFTLRPTMIFVYLWYGLATLVVLGTAALAGWLASYRTEWFSGMMAFLVILFVGLLAYAIPVIKHLLRLREVYTLTSHQLEMRYGILAKTTQNIPLRNIQEVTVSASFWQRLMRLGDIEIESASETGKIRLSEIHHPDRYAAMILAELRRRN